MARMKIEAAYQYGKRSGFSRKDRLIAGLPALARRVAKMPLAAGLLNLRNHSGMLRVLGEKWFGIAAERTLPKWRSDTFAKNLTGALQADLTDCDVVLWADTFNNAYEPEHLHAALAVMHQLGFRVAISGAASVTPLCCGRTHLSVGMIEEARGLAQQTLAALAPALARGVPVVGLEPSCILGMREEWQALGLGPPANALASQAMLFEEWWVQHGRQRWDASAAKPLPAIWVHGHCHQKAMGAMSATITALESLGSKPQLIESSCCGMAGSFGYEARHLQISLAMAEASLLPAVRNMPEDAWVVADGFSCRHQIRDGARRSAKHVAEVIAHAIT
jgi:Fe-S oxidoreductase